MNYSISKRSIYPDMDLESQPDPGTERSQWSEYDRWGMRSRKGISRRDTDRSEPWNKGKGELQLLEELEEDIAEAYHSQQHSAVIAKGKDFMRRVKGDLEREEGEGELNEMEVRVKNFMALSFIKRYRKNRDQKMLLNAKKLLKV